MGQCPNCGETLDDKAVLCIDCGFHLFDGRLLSRATSGDATASDSAESIAEIDNSDSVSQPANPYSPVLDDQLSLTHDSPLTESEAQRAKVIADSAMPVYLSILLTFCFCLPVLPLFLPYQLYRAMQWWQMYQRHPQLRQPNSLSPFADVELRFQAAGWKFAVSILCGAIATLVFSFFAVFAYLKEA